MNDEHHVYHITPFKTYIKVFAVLLFLTAITVWVATVDFGALNALIAFGIATAKAALVIFYFMHMKYDTVVNRIVLGSGFVLLFLLFLFCAIDIATRVKVV